MDHNKSNKGHAMYEESVAFSMEDQNSSSPDFEKETGPVEQIVKSKDQPATRRDSSKEENTTTQKE